MCSSTDDGGGKTCDTGKVIGRKAGNKALVDGCVLRKGGEGGGEEDMVDLGSIGGGEGSVGIFVGQCECRVEGVWGTEEEVKNRIWV